MYYDTVQELINVAYSITKPPSKHMSDEEFAKRSAQLWAIEELIKRCVEDMSKDPEDIMFEFAIELSAFELMASNNETKSRFMSAYKAIKDLEDYIKEEI